LFDSHPKIEDYDKEKLITMIDKSNTIVQKYIEIMGKNEKSTKLINSAIEYFEYLKNLC
jgi:hypothetical protein